MYKKRVFIKLFRIVYFSLAWTLFWYFSLALVEFVFYSRVYELNNLILFLFIGTFYAYINGYDANIYLIDKIKERRDKNKLKHLKIKIS